MALGEDPHFANISTSVIQPTSSGEAAATAKPSSSGDDEDFSLSSELMGDYKREQRLQAKLREDLAHAELNATTLMAELELERAKFEEERSQREAQTNAFIQESNRLCSTAEQACATQEQFHQEMEERLTCQEKITLSLQQGPPTKSINTAGVSSPIRALLDTYHDLDDDSKKALMTTVISTNNVDLQRALITLRQDQNNSGRLANLAKELIKLADTYKVPELCFEEQAKKRRYNYHTWISKLRLILAMFSQTSPVLVDDEIIPFSDDTCIGNKALYLLIGYRVDGYY
jgi:hypothetical protein